MSGRWLIFQVTSLLIACALAALTWDRATKWYAQPLLVAFWIALSPLLLRGAFLNAQVRSGQEEWRSKTAIFIVGMSFAELLNIVLGCLNIIPWSLVGAIVGGCAVLQIGSFVLYRRRGKPAPAK